VSFILAPVASNAPEIIASISYSAKKTKKTISISLANLQGVGCMNITFALGIFYMLFLIDHHLIWEFSAESTSLLAIQLIMTFMAFLKTIRVYWAFILIGL